MKLRATVWLAGLLSGILWAQSAAPVRPTGTPVSGAGGTRANGVAPAEPGLTGTRSTSQPAATENKVPARLATGSVQVIGQDADIRGGTADRPLLPIAAQGNAFGIRSGTPIRVVLKKAVTSAHARNGDLLDGALATPLAGMPAGTPVRLTVVAVARAGELSSFGELSLQVVSIANRTVLSNIVTAEGLEGSKELPDAAPGRGTEAVFTPGQTISLPAA